MTQLVQEVTVQAQARSVLDQHSVAFFLCFVLELQRRSCCKRHAPPRPPTPSLPSKEKGNFLPPTAATRRCADWSASSVCASHPQSCLPTR